MLDLARSLATALADAVETPEYDQLGHGQAAQALQQNRLRQRGD
jgi:hypothetical protein